MTDYHQRFKERFPNLAPEYDGTPDIPAILAFIDEVVAETHANRDKIEVLATKRALERGRTVLISHIEGIKAETTKYPAHKYMSGEDIGIAKDYNKGYNQALDDLLTYLRDKQPNHRS